jgi:PhoPQ-activated pathogenicity-related protein
MKLWLGAFLVVPAWAAETALDLYVAKPDSAYSYQHYATDNAVVYTTYFLEMVSQQWRTAAEVDRPVWEHDLAITVPALLTSPSRRTALLLVDGGSNGHQPPTRTDDLMSALALATGSVVATVGQIPNEPLYFADEGGRARSEDAILAYNLDKYIDTGDPEWIVHLPMTKAVVRAMDTVQQFLATKSIPVDDFIVVGGSKRGWATWLTAAVDHRVKAIVPISIDLLNLGEQFVHHWEAYRFYAPALADYVEFDLPCRLQSKRGRDLLDIIDPYAYRDRYTMPKLIINSAGDQFFTSDSSQFYFKDLPGPKLMRYTFNTDHAQGESTQDIANLLISALLWEDDVNRGRSGPQFSWTFEDNGAIRVQTANPRPDRVYLWQATNPEARDFRLESLGPAWTRSRLYDSGDGVYIGKVSPPTRGFTAYAVELQYDEDLIPGLSLTQTYTTDVRVTPDILPFAGTSCPAISPGVLENPTAGSFESGIAVIRGWVCGARAVDVQIDGGSFYDTAYGTVREDTAGVCGDTDNGFGLLFNMNRLGGGTHRLRALADGREIGETTFSVKTFGVEFLRGASGTYVLPGFPSPGHNVSVTWQESLQNFSITAAGGSGPRVDAASSRTGPGRQG